MTVGVVVVTFNARDIILDCLESLLASTSVDLRIIVVDNASNDDTVALIQNWSQKPEVWTASEGAQFTPAQHGPITLVENVPTAGTPQIALIANKANVGFAGGVNVGLRLLQADADVDYFWVLNPDCTAENNTAAELEKMAAKVAPFSLIGGRIFYKEPHLMIQSDGGRINFNTGTCIPFNLAKMGRDVPPPNAADLDYISGTHMFASRPFLEQAGLMPEEYFLYYEEMDWCCRRGDLPMYFSAQAAVHHDGGHTLGSATMSRGPSPLSSYYMGRSRMMFVWRYRPWALPLTFAYSVAKVAKLALKGHTKSGLALLRGVCGFKPSMEIRRKLKPSLNPPN